jgi:hypothetical protein
VACGPEVRGVFPSSARVAQPADARAVGLLTGFVGSVCGNG